MLRITAIVSLLTCCVALVFVYLAKANGQATQQPGQPNLPQRIRVSGEVMLGLVDHKTMPVYPSEAMLKGTRGDVIFKVEIDEKGKVLLAVPVEGDPLLVAASVDALREFRFRPYLINGSPLIVETQIGFHFSLKKKSSGINGKVECLTKVPSRPEFWTGVETDPGVLVLDPDKIAAVEPQLPPALVGKSGSVYLTISVGADGKVNDVKILGGDEPFIAPVVDAVKQDIYEPRLLRGKPSTATIDASYHFGLQQ